jgi:LysM repeat protein
VRNGDNFYSIGQRVGIPWEVIAQVNGMTERSLLLPGLRLRLPTPTPADAPPVQPASPAPMPQPTPTEPPPVTTYRVQAGDSLMKIAARYGIGWEAIAQANGITARTMLRVGQELVIPTGQ